jgi:Glyoxalase-like domain
MSFEIDHIVMAARTLEEGVAFVEEMLKIKAAPGGKHPSVGTHNALVPLTQKRYLEIIAIDPEVSVPPRVRWFGLDEPELQAKLASGPKLVAYVVRATEIPMDLRFFPELDPQPAKRGDFSWTFGFTADGKRPGMGALPYFISWDAGSAHPCERLPAAQIALNSIEISLPCAPSVQMAMNPLGVSEVRFVDAPKFGLAAQLREGERTFVLEG